MKLITFLIFTLTLLSCGSKENKNIFAKKISDYNNNFSAYYFIDSIIINNKNINIYSTDTLGYYNNTRHTQYYSWTCASILNKKDLNVNIDSIIFQVKMPNRRDGNIINSASKNQILEILSNYNEPEFRNKIIALNKLNHKLQLESYKNGHGDLIDNLNMYISHTTKSGDQWAGTDSYYLIKGYVYNRQMGYDISEHKKIFNSILNDTIYWKNDSLKKQIFDLVIQ